MRFTKVSIIIPVYNEEKYIKKTIERVINSNSLKLRKEIIVVDDGSTDSTPKILNAFHRKVNSSTSMSIFILYKKENEGKGSAIREGLRKVTGDIIIIQDADLEYNPKDYPSLIEPFINANAQVVYGSRTLGMKVFGNQYSSLLYYLGGRLLTFCVNILYKVNLTDQPTGYKLFTSELVPIILKQTQEKDFSYEIEMTALFSKKRHKIVEVPVTYKPRTKNEGKKIKFPDFIKAISVGLRWKLINGN